MPAESTKEQALEALTGMATIVKREMLVRGSYVGDRVVNKKLAEEGAICQGRKYCAVGSLWVGAGIKPKVTSFGYARLPGVFEHERDRFITHRPGLKLAYEKVNEAARDYARKNGIEDILDRTPKYRAGPWEAEIEALFESKSRRPGAKVGRPELLQIINSAKRKVRAA